MPSPPVPAPLRFWGIAAAALFMLASCRHAPGIGSPALEPSAESPQTHAESSKPAGESAVPETTAPESAVLDSVVPAEGSSDESLPVSEQETRPRPEPADSAAVAEELLQSLTLRQRIGQRFIAHIPGSNLRDGAGRAILAVAPAGFIVYPWNFDTGDDMRRLAASLQNFTEYVTPGVRLLLCADQEGGRVATFRLPETVAIPSAREMGDLSQTAGSDPVRAAAYLTGVGLKNLGLNMNLAPVLDSYSGERTTVIGDRSYSGDPEIVSSLVGPYLAGANASGVISVAKHFPGHGITAVDSHNELPVVTAPRAEIERHMQPFVTAIEAGVDVVMTAHVLFTKIDPTHPVTLSHVFLRTILREDLKFNGVVMSDGLEMGAIRRNYDLEDSLVRMFTYDVDLILLYLSHDVVEIVDMVERLIEAGRISIDDVDRGARRVLELKVRYGVAGNSK